MLLVSLSLWKETTLFIHCSPVAGESGWMYILLGISGSALPETIHLLLWNLYLQSSTATMSTNMTYLALFSKPVIFTLNGGNILLNRPINWSQLLSNGYLNSGHPIGWASEWVSGWVSEWLGGDDIQSTCLRCINKFADRKKSQHLMFLSRITFVKIITFANERVPIIGK